MPTEWMPAVFRALRAFPSCSFLAILLLQSREHRRLGLTLCACYWPPQVRTELAELKAAADAARAAARAAEPPATASPAGGRGSAAAAAKAAASSKATAGGDAPSATAAAAAQPAPAQPWAPTLVRLAKGAGDLKALMASAPLAAVFWVAAADEMQLAALQAATAALVPRGAAPGAFALGVCSVAASPANEKLADALKIKIDASAPTAQVRIFSVCVSGLWCINDRKQQLIPILHVFLG